MSSAATYALVVSAASSGMRLDKFLTEALPALSRSRVQQLIEQGHVGLGGMVLADAARKVKTGDALTLHVPAAVPTELIAQSIPLDVLFEDEALLIVNKPPGLTVHPAAGHASGTLVNALLAYCGDRLSGIGGEQRPGIVHRLDKDTSGLMVVAKNDAAHRALSAQLKDRTLHRHYLALVHGVPAPGSGIIETQLGRDPRHRKKMAVLAKGGKPAITRYQLQASYGQPAPVLSLVEYKLATGRTHQIRVHSAHAGCPLVGDATYGARLSGKKQAALTQALGEAVAQQIVDFPRQALHAFRLGLIHPVRGEAMQWEAPLPNDLKFLINLVEPLKTSH